MLEGLQKTTVGYRKTSPSFRSAEIILDDKFAPKATAFIKDAVSEIRMTAYAWRWYDSEPALPIQVFNLELLRASNRGVQVRILVDTEAMRSLFAGLGFNVRSVQPTRMLHTKAILIDRRSLILGSHNLTKRASSDNYEMSVALQDFEAAEQFCEYFDGIWHSRG